MKRFLTVVILILIGWNAAISYQLFQLSTKPNQTGTTIGSGEIQSARSDISSDVSDLVQKSENKVVTVVSTNGGRQIGSGSGAIYQKDKDVLYIITNNHVVEKGTGAIITFADGSEGEAEIIGKDALTDLALLKVKADVEAEVFTMGDSSLLKKGEYVIAMGSPLGINYQGSVTGGLISGTDRKVESDSDGNGVADWDMNVLQIDAAINPGNSGGPLINMAGELIGINSMKITETDVEGFGFSIPINEVIPIIQQLQKDGEVRRPNFGISGTDISLLSYFELSRYDIRVDSGILIVNVQRGEAADNAGIQAGDVLMKMDDTEIENVKQFRQILYSKQVGDTIQVVINRDGNEESIEVTLT